jgi:hypothetical protein
LGRGGRGEEVRENVEGQQYTSINPPKKYLKKKYNSFVHEVHKFTVHKLG